MITYIEKHLFLIKSYELNKKIENSQQFCLHILGRVVFPSGLRHTVLCLVYLQSNLQGRNTIALYGSLFNEMLYSN